MVTLVLTGCASAGSSAMSSGCAERAVVVRATEHTAIDGAGIVSGIVSDAATLRPVSGPTVVSLLPGRRSVTDSLGRFRFDSVPPGVPVALVFQSFGFFTQRDTVHLAPGGGVALHVFLTYERICLEPLTIPPDSQQPSRLRRLLTPHPHPPPPR